MIENNNKTTFYDLNKLFCVEKCEKLGGKSPQTPKMSQRKLQKVMVQPVNLIFRYLQNRTRVQIWLYEDITHRLEGYIIGFDEFMNVVFDEAEEVNMKTKGRNKIGRILLKGDNITLIHAAQQEA